MQAKKGLTAVATLLFVALPARTQNARPPADYDPDFNYDCERACLNGLVDEFLVALVAHDPARLPLHREVKYTENGQLLRLGDGIWGTASALPTYKIYAADPEAGQVMFMGVLQENDAPVIFCARLKIELHQIAEIEVVVSRKEPGSLARPENLVQPNPIFSETLAPAQRRSRQNMIAIANSYFNAIEKGHASYVPFDSNCNRIESGVQTTNSSPASPQPGSVSVLSLGCADQIKTRNFQPDTLIRERRFAVIDQERGLVFVLGFFDHDATLRSYTLADGRTVKQTRSAPWTWEIAEMFKIQDGKIMRVEALVNPAPYGMKSGW
ncbi:MAG TPA: hypothetical protein VEJ45_11505 [Candidatus Acidoferrales bacterium]|nr:hypothetical protein [Candidatus Acidoferrales bacterium]